MVRPGHGSTSFWGHGSTSKCNEDMVRLKKTANEDIVQPKTVFYELIMLKKLNSNCVPLLLPPSLLSLAHSKLHNSSYTIAIRTIGTALA